MTRLFAAFARYFFRGLLFVVPVGATLYVVYVVVVTLDRWIGIERWTGVSIPGAGLVITVSLITLIGLLASFFATRWAFGIMDRLFAQVPFVKLLYSSFKDLTGAFVGEEKKFDKPVVVLLPGSEETAVLGFLTRESLKGIGGEDSVGVYVPQSYNFAGNLIVVPRSRIRPIDADSAAIMTLIVSGGVSGSTGETPRS